MSQRRVLPLGRIGMWDVSIVSGGRFRTDGGAMFGVVPKSLWSRVMKPDDANLIAQDTNCLLLQSVDTERIAVIDTGYGGKLSDKQRAWMHAEPSDPLLTSLAEAGVAPDAVTDVLFSHLHYDHCGGASRIVGEGSDAQRTFPNATHYVQTLEWQTAVDNPPELKGAYPQDNIVAIQDARWVYCDGAHSLSDADRGGLPSVEVLPSPGHTEGHQAILISDAEMTVAYLGDLVPTIHHLPVLWCMGFDVHMAETRRSKLALLERAVDEQWTAIFNHDPDIPAAKIVRDPRKGFAKGDVIATWNDL